VGQRQQGVRHRELTARLYLQSVVVEPGDVFFAGTRPPRQNMRIGYSSIPVERIAAGVCVIGRELDSMRRALEGR
jgi:GntR family transcriptional regulator/MocR family aminotransferase